VVVGLFDVPEIIYYKFLIDFTTTS